MFFEDFLNDCTKFTLEFKKYAKEISSCKVTKTCILSLMNARLNQNNHIPQELFPCGMTTENIDLMDNLMNKCTVLSSAGRSPGHIVKLKTNNDRVTFSQIKKSFDEDFLLESNKNKIKERPVLSEINSNSEDFQLNETINNDNNGLLFTKDLKSLMKNMKEF